MSIWTDLAVREAALLAILFVLGIGPASLLSSRFDSAARIALAPVLGFCLGTCVTTTLLYFFAAGDTYLVLVVLMAASAAFGVRRMRRDGPRPAIGVRDVAQLLVVCAVIAGPVSFVLHERHTVGPAVLYFTDGANYVGTQQAAERSSLREADEQWDAKAKAGVQFANLTDRTFAFLADFGSNLDATPLHANVNALLGVAAIDTFGPFLIVLLLMGALGVFAAVRVIAGRPTWMAALAGALFGGPLFIELYFDTFQAAIIALGLLLPAVVLGAEALRERRPANLVLVALVMATFISVYPLFVPPLVAIAVAALGWQVLARRRAGEGVAAIGRSLLAPALAVAALAAAFNAVGLVRTVGYYVRLVDGGVPLPRVAFKLPPEVLPGWLLQTREFWYLLPVDLGSPRQLVFVALVPIAMLAFAAVAVRRHPIALALLGLGALAGLLAYASYAGQDACSYCGQRYLLALAPVFVVLIALGLAAALGSPGRLWQAIGVAGALIVVVFVGQRARVELDRFADQSFFFDTANRVALQDLPRDGRPLQLEGYWATANAAAEQPLTYHLATDRAPGRVSISLGSNQGSSLEYLNFGQVLPPGPEFRAGYRYLLTRFSGVATDRRLIARRGAIALLERTRPLDVTPYSGLSIGPARIDGSGIPTVQPNDTVGLYVVGRASGPVFARLEFATAQAVRVPAQRGVRARTTKDRLTVCVRATGKAPIRNARVRVPAAAAGTVQLRAMHALSGRCTP